MCGSDIFLQDGSRENISKRKKLYAAFMDLEKAYDRVDWLALWDVLKIHGVGGKLLSAIKSFYEEASACVRISGDTSELFEIKVGLRQGCVMSPWLFNIYMDGVMREMKGKVGEAGVRMYAEREMWAIVGEGIRAQRKSEGVRTRE